MGAETSKLQEATDEVQQEIEQQAAVQEVRDVATAGSSKHAGSSAQQARPVLLRHPSFGML